MDYLIALLVGTLVAFVGILLPGMLNMTAVSVSVKNGKRAGMLFAAGMAVTTSFQAFIAFGSADYLRRHEEVVEQIHSFAFFLFLLLAIIFISKGKASQAIKTKTISRRKLFGGGMGMGFLNALSVLYFFAIGTVLTSRDVVQTGIFSVLLFSIGAGVGAFLVFWLYVKTAGWISDNADWFTRNMNYVIGGFFVFLAGLQGYYMFG